MHWTSILGFTCPVNSANHGLKSRRMFTPNTLSRMNATIQVGANWINRRPMIKPREAWGSSLVKHSASNRQGKNRLLTRPINNKRVTVAVNCYFWDRSKPGFAFSSSGFKGKIKLFGQSILKITGTWSEMHLLLILKLPTMIIDYLNKPVGPIQTV